MDTLFMSILCCWDLFAAIFKVKDWPREDFTGQFVNLFGCLKLSWGIFVGLSAAI